MDDPPLYGELMDPEVGRHSPTTSQVDGTPTAKVTAGALSGAAVTIVISVAKSFGVELEPEVAAALVVVVASVASYFKSSRPGDNDR